MRIKIYHMSGAGNKFAVINAIENPFILSQLEKLAPLLCTKSKINPYYSEGLISVDIGYQGLDFCAEFLNPDGSHGAMCGNGGRCAVRFALELNFCKDEHDFINFSMAGNNYIARINKDNSISVNFPSPVQIVYSKELRLKSGYKNVGYVNVGSDHTVFDFNDLSNKSDFDDFDLISFAQEIRFHSDFNPNGTNVNLFKVSGDRVILRTYERGVEAETGACGTGAISTALIASKKYDLDFPIIVTPTSKEEIKVDIIGSKNNISGLVLTGPAVILDSYFVNISDDLFN